MHITTENSSFILQENETLLEALERTGHDVDYQCRSGYCGMCRVKMYSGSVCYAETPLAFIGRNEILPCCCTVLEPLHLAVRLKPEQADLLQEDLFENTEK